MAKTEKAIPQPAYPKKKMLRSTTLSSLIAVLCLILSVYSIGTAIEFFKGTYSSRIPDLTLPIALLVCSIFLLKEMSQRSILSRLKRHYDRYI